jgi:hypothetical protein
MWWAATPHELWPEDDESFQHIKSRWQEPFGDRQQELVIIGMEMDKSILTASFDACLLTDAELALGMDAWKTMDDPFPKWPNVEPTPEVA